MLCNQHRRIPSPHHRNALRVWGLPVSASSQPHCRRLGTFVRPTSSVQLRHLFWRVIRIPLQPPSSLQLLCRLWSLQLLFRNQLLLCCTFLHLRASPASPYPLRLCFMPSAMLPSTALCASSHSSPYALLAPCPRSASSLNSVLRRSAIRRGERLLVSAVQKSPKGFGKAPEKEKKQKLKKESDGSLQTGLRIDKQEQVDDVVQEEPEDDVVPEVVTNRMLKRITYTVGIPFAVGIAFFGLFYYLKAVKKVDIPEWLPLFTSLLTFGSSGAGITYGVLSASWDPKREGSLLGWKEAQLNWPVFWETFRGKREDGKSR